MAQLFVVPKQPVQVDEIEDSEESDVFELSGDMQADLATALRAYAFLLDFIDSVGGSDGLRATAEQIHNIQVPR